MIYFLKIFSIILYHCINNVRMLDRIKSDNLGFVGGMYCEVTTKSGY